MLKRILTTAIASAFILSPTFASQQDDNQNDDKPSIKLADTKDQGAQLAHEGVELLVKNDSNVLQLIENCQRENKPNPAVLTNGDLINIITRDLSQRQLLNLSQTSKKIHNTCKKCLLWPYPVRISCFYNFEILNKGEFINAQLLVRPADKIHYLLNAPFQNSSRCPFYGKKGGAMQPTTLSPSLIKHLVFLRSDFPIQFKFSLRAINNFVPLIDEEDHAKDNLVSNYVFNMDKDAVISQEGNLKIEAIQFLIAGERFSNMDKVDLNIRKKK